MALAEYFATLPFKPQVGPEKITYEERPDVVGPMEKRVGRFVPTKIVRGPDVAVVSDFVKDPGSVQDLPGLPGDDMTSMKQRISKPIGEIPVLEFQPGPRLKNLSFDRPINSLADLVAAENLRREQDRGLEFRTALLEAGLTPEDVRAAEVADKVERIRAMKQAAITAGRALLGNKVPKGGSVSLPPGTMAAVGEAVGLTPRQVARLGEPVLLDPAISAAARERAAAARRARSVGQFERGSLPPPSPAQTVSTVGTDPRAFELAAAGFGEGGFAPATAAAAPAAIAAVGGAGAGGDPFEGMTTAELETRYLQPIGSTGRPSGGQIGRSTFQAQLATELSAIRGGRTGPLTTEEKELSRRRAIISILRLRGAM